MTCRSTGAHGNDPAWHAGAGQPDNPEALVNTLDRATESGAFRVTGNPIDRLKGRDALTRHERSYRRCRTWACECRWARASP
jgi:hypothetical protein